MFDLIGRLKARWIAERMAIRPGATPEAIDAFEARYGVAMPPDPRAYFATVDGMNDNDWDRDHFCHFYPLGRCVPIAEHCERLAHLEWASRYFLLVDHSIEVFFYAIRLSPDPSEECPVILWDPPGPDRWTFSPSFTSFLERYLNRHAFFQVEARVED